MLKFLLDLCIEFGEPDPAVMIKKLGNNARTLALWAAYNRRDPFGYKRHNLHMIQMVMAWSKVSDPERLMIGDATPEMDAMIEQARKAKDNG